MALIVVDELKRRADEVIGDYISPERLCVAADDTLVSCDDPAAVRLLVPAGGRLTRADATKYGLLVSADEALAEAIARAEAAEAALAAAAGGDAAAAGDGAGEKQAEPTANKGRKAATEDKAAG